MKRWSYVHITKVFFGHHISRKLADQNPHVQQQVLQYAELESYGPAVHGELGSRFDSSCHGLQTERQFVALAGFCLQRCSQSVGKCIDRVCRKLPAPVWRRRTRSRPAKCGRGIILHSRTWCDLGRRGFSQPLWWRARQVRPLLWPLRSVCVGSDSNCVGGHDR
jgi:hypothetical protein